MENFYVFISLERFGIYITAKYVRKDNLIVDHQPIYEYGNNSNIFLIELKTVLFLSLQN